MTDLMPEVKMRGLVNFPVSVTGRTGINVVKVAGRYYFDLDVSRLVESTNIPAEQVDQYWFTIWNKQLNSFVNIPYSIAATAGVSAIDGHTGALDIGNGLTFTGDVLEHISVPTIAALKALDGAVHSEANLTADGRAGLFVWRAGNYSTHVAADTNSGVYVKADAISASSGAWVRQFDFQNYYSRWFGTVADHSTDNTTKINTIITVSDLTNTLTTPGKQSAAYIHIEGGVRFASTGLSFLPLADDVFVYLRYFANSDTTKGVSNGGGATNEFCEMSVNSGYPGDPTGGMVAQWSMLSPLHPAHCVHANKNAAGADAHFQPGQVRLPTDVGPVRASYNIIDENVLRFRMFYEGYGNDNAATGAYFQPFIEKVSLNSVGSISWPTTPVAGTIVTGTLSGAKGYKASVQSNPTVALDVIWTTGTFIPGDHLTDGVTTSTDPVGGGGVSKTSPSNTYFALGINHPVAVYGVFPGHAVTGFDIAARLTSRISTGSEGGENHKETVTNAAHLFTNTAGGIPTTGRQIVLDNNNRLVTVNGVANGTGATGNGFVGGVAAWGNLTNAGGVSTNAGNIASAARTGTGTYGLAFTNPLANANFSVALTRSNVADYFTITGITTGGFQINCFNSSNALTDLVGTVYFTVNGGM